MRNNRLSSLVFDPRCASVRDRTADDQLSVYSLPARIAEVHRSNEYALNERGSLEDGSVVSLLDGREENLSQQRASTR